MHWGTDPQRAQPDRVRSPEPHALPLRRARPASSPARPTTTRRARTGSRSRRPRSRSSPATPWAPPTTGSAPPDPYSFTTPQPPPGRFLFSIALCNDLHMGETTAGLNGSIPELTGIQQVPGLPPYPEVMLESLVEDADALGAQLPAGCRRHLRRGRPARPQPGGTAAHAGSGGYRSDYFVTRGNHDRAHTGDAYAQLPGRTVAGQRLLPRPLLPGRRAHLLHAATSQGLRVLGIDTYDKPGNGGDAGALSPDQLAWFRAQLAERPRPPDDGVRPPPARRRGLTVPDHGEQHARSPPRRPPSCRTTPRMPGMFLHHAGHTHRNNRTISPLAPKVTLQEIAAGKEYPGGFSLLRLHTGGFALNFYKSRSDQARAWSERSRQEIFGLLAAVRARRRRRRPQHDGHARPLGPAPRAPPPVGP